MKDIILKPLITEKMTTVSEKFGNRYGFVVVKTATKDEIKSAVEELYDVNVVSVNTLIYAGKRKARGTKRGFIAGHTRAFKKAVVTLKKDQVIDFYSNV
jgi:large subunit ribosomal protein L23